MRFLIKAFFDANTNKQSFVSDDIFTNLKLEQTIVLDELDEVNTGTKILKLFKTSTVLKQAELPARVLFQHEFASTKDVTKVGSSSVEP